jgi:hypothetical protein
MCLSEKRIQIACPRTTRDKDEDYLADLILQEQKFGVCILISKTLVGNEKILESKIDDLVKSHLNDGFVKSSPATGGSMRA